MDENNLNRFDNNQTNEFGNQNEVNSVDKEVNAKLDTELDSRQDKEAETENNIPSDSDEWGDISEDKTLWEDLGQWIKAIALAVVIAYLINVFVFERARVDGDSMLTTLHNEESLFEYKLGYLFGHPQRGEIIIFEFDSGKFESKFIPFDKDQVNYVKRVIGLPGETVDIHDGSVYINGNKLIEPYLDEGVTTDPAMNGVAMQMDVQYPYTIPEGTYFVLGDNRPHSQDSRYIGAVPEKKIRGKVEFVMLPIDSIRSVTHTKPYFEGEQDPN